VKGSVPAECRAVLRPGRVGRKPFVPGFHSSGRLWGALETGRGKQTMRPDEWVMMLVLTGRGSAAPALFARQKEEEHG